MREQLVKGRVATEEGWKPLSTRLPTRFSPQSTEIPQTAPPPKGGDLAAEQSLSSTAERPEAISEPLQQSAATQMPERKPPPLPDFEESPASSPQPEVDLSQYMPISEAQSKIESARLEGIQAGISQAEEDYGSAIKALNNICTQLSTLQETIIKNSSGELLDFALAITDRILRFSVTDQDETIVATIEEALQRAIRSEEFTIYLHPEDIDIVQQKSADIIAGISGLDNILLKSDPAVGRGGARLESDNCTIDATLASQFETIRDEILRAR